MELPPGHEQVLKSLTFPLGWKPDSDPVLWKEKGRAAFRELLWEPTVTDPRPFERAREARDGYHVRHLELSLSRFGRSAALLAVPDGPGPFPALLLLHDHGAYFQLGKEKMIRPLADGPVASAQAWADTNYEGAFVGDEGARRGWVVLSVDALGWGERAVAGYESQQALASNLLGLGTSWAGQILEEDRAAAAYLASLPQVDAGRVAALGHSMGSFRAWQLHAVSDDVRAAVAVCSFGTTAGLLAPGGNRTRGQSAFSMTHPGLTRLMDYPDVAALAAPKPLYMIHGADDALFPQQTVRQAYESTAAVYAAWDKRDAFLAEFRPGGHVFTREDQKKAWSWLERRSLLS